MGVRNLTEKFCSSVTEVGKYRDNRRQGLFLVVQKTGSKNWGQILHVKDSGEKPELGLGGFPTISLAEARQIASENHALARRGINPKKTRAFQQTIPSFAELAEEVIQSKRSGWTNDKSEKQWRSTLKMYAFPVIGRLPVSEITSRHIAIVLKPIWTTKVDTASKLRGRIESVLDLAIYLKHLEAPNPATLKGNLEFELPKRSRNGGHRPAVSQKDAHRWWSALMERDGISQKALQILMLTASRGKEIRKMAWGQLEIFDDRTQQKNGYAGIWRRDVEIMKMRTRHEVPLTHYMLGVIKSTGTSDGLVFPSPQSGKMLSENALNKMMKDMHYADPQGGFFDIWSKKRAVSHGLRSTFRDWAGEHGLAHEVAEIQMSHKIGDAAQQAYFRTQLLKKRANASDDFLIFLQTPEGSKDPTNESEGVGK